MSRHLLSIAAAFVIVPSLAFAHGPTRQKTSESIEINAAPDKVWAVLGEFSDMSWHPQVTSVKATDGNNKGSIRTITYASGETMEEELSRYDADKMRFGTFIGQTNIKVIPATNYSSNVSVKPGDAEGTSEVTWSAAFYRGYPNNDPPAELNDEAAVTGVGTYITEGLDGLKKAVEAGS
ncbi:SRPBCC family protein [Fulvimarina sp. 2208YS6-2-32]|uniref:SRPBCC family protein n=1 Tax=Fulvimarina uroteuthidis TaxID=3098149 RepID=A0ABU5I105_9HYPH|nr:SRPBCC family protein [Fulvimarina sp. 2208YS6-2-32]MDY8109027.1 SRPBCC family protein [Fulvimarina sp. 2208YS6-2-32]